MLKNKKVWAALAGLAAALATLFTTLGDAQAFTRSSITKHYEDEMIFSIEYGTENGQLATRVGIAWESGTWQREGYIQYHGDYLTGTSTRSYPVVFASGNPAPTTFTYQVLTGYVIGFEFSSDSSLDGNDNQVTYQAVNDGFTGSTDQSGDDNGIFYAKFGSGVHYNYDPAQDLTTSMNAYRYSVCFDSSITTAQEIHIFHDSTNPYDGSGGISHTTTVTDDFDHWHHSYMGFYNFIPCYGVSFWADDSVDGVNQADYEVLLED